MMAHKFCGTLGLTLVLSAGLHGAEVIPPRPAHYFNDYAGIIPPAVAGQLDRQLEQFERDTTNQMLVVVYPRMESKSSVADYAVRVAQAWGVGQKGKDNGAVLFVFMQERQLYIQVGYGLEGALPDGLCHLIVANELQPRFRSGDYAGGLQSAVNAMLAAARGEYRGTGRTHAEARLDLGWPVGVAFLLLISVFAYLNRYWRSAVYQSSGGRRSSWGAPTIWLGGSGFGGGGFGGGGGGGFSAGGGGFGGGGAGGGW
jgi:uncharacterized protein